MKLDKLVKTLRRDLTANPLKAGVLGVLLLGGIYFWGPLVWKWLGFKGTANAPAAAATPGPVQEHASSQNASVEPGVGSAEIKETAINWGEIRSQRETDLLVRSAEYRPEWNQIFHDAQNMPDSRPQEEVEPPMQKQVDPRELGLVLQGVTIGPKTKKAIINGMVYRERDLITVSQKSDSTGDTVDQLPDLEFRLVRVFRKMVEVERGGKTWQLKLPVTEPANSSSGRSPQTDPSADEPPEEKDNSPEEKSGSKLKKEA